VEGEVEEGFRSLVQERMMVASKRRRRETVMPSEKARVRVVGYWS
jgi:hypothetical protein